MALLAKVQRRDMANPVDPCRKGGNAACRCDGGETMPIARRAIDSLHRRDWAATGIELLVVIVGVFIGLQAANWNEDRLSAQRGAGFAERLKDDLRIEAWNYEMQIGYHAQVRANAMRAADALAGRADLSEEALLVAAYRATQYNDDTRQSTTYDELISTGEMGLVVDPALRKLAMDLYSTPVFEWLPEEGRASQYRQWFRKHMPHHVQDAVALACGDRVVLPGDYAGIGGALDYACLVELSAADMASAAETLRNDPDALPLLRLRIADTATNIAQLEYYSGTSVRDQLRRIAAESG